MMTHHNACYLYKLFAYCCAYAPYLTGRFSLAAVAGKASNIKMLLCRINKTTAQTRTEKTNNIWFLTGY